MNLSFSNAGLLIRLVWTVAVPLVAALNADLDAGLALAIGVWLLLTIAAESLAPRLVSLTDFGFALAAITLTGLETSPLWWILLIGALLSSMRHGMLAGIGFIGAALVILIGGGFVAGAIEAEGLGALGRAMLALLMLAPLASWLGSWLQARSGAPDPAADQGGDEPVAASMLDLTAELNANLSEEHVPDLVVRLASQLLDAADNQLRSTFLIQRESGFSLPMSDTVSVEPGAGLLAKALAAGSPQQSNQAVNDPALLALGIADGASSAACVPLMASGKPQAALMLTHPNPDYFNAERMELLEAIGRQASIALQNARMLRGLELERDRITETEEEARRKLARDLHDGPTQTIAAIAMRLDFARRLVDRDREAARQEIQTLEQIARQTTREIRHMLFTLRPLVLESKGLVAALHQLASKMHETHGQNVLIEALPGVADGLDMSKQAVVFFIAEEAINNAHKHAEAGNIQVHLGRADGDRIVLEVRDDGVGFNVGAVDAHYDQRGSLGMVNMRERAELVSGVLHIESAEGNGTHITLEIPLAGEPEH